MGYSSRQSARQSAKLKFKQLKKENKQYKNMSFANFYKLYKLGFMQESVDHADPPVTLTDDMNELESIILDDLEDDLTKMRVLNEKLSAGVSTPVLFVFDPTEIPVTDEGLVGEGKEYKNKHYASIVYDVNAKEFTILEYSLKIFRAVASYKERHGKLAQRKVLLTRHPDGRFKMNLGNTDELITPFSEEEKQQVDSDLVTLYKNNFNYKVNDL